MALTLGLVVLTIALLGSPSTALTIPEVIITLSLLTQQNDGAHAGPGNPDHRSPWGPSTALTIPEVVIILSTSPPKGVFTESINYCSIVFSI